MMKTDKPTLRRELEGIAADLRHAYEYLAPCRLTSVGQQNVAGLIARNIRRLEKLLKAEDAEEGSRYVR